MLEVKRAAGLPIRILTAVYLGSVGLIPVALGLWAYYPARVVEYPPVYFAYTSVLVFPSDILVVIALVSDVGLRLLTGRPLAGRPDPVVGALLLLAGWAAASAAWSPEPALSLYYGLHLGLVGALAASVAARPQIWTAVAAGSLVGIAVQVGVGAAEVMLQTTAFLGPLGLVWPGQLNPSMPGAAVVELPGGTRWLRAYGTFPHPNLLATYLVGLVAGPVSWTLGRDRVRVFWGLGGVGLAAAGLGLTFSRAGWVALPVGLLWVLGSRQLPAARRRWLAAAATAGFLAAVLPFGSVLDVRLGMVGLLEARSVLERGWLMAQAADLIRAHGLLGLGAGTFPLALRDRLPPGYRAEPAHNVGILLLTELGPVGGGIGLGLLAAILTRLRRSAGPDGLALSGALLGLLVLGLADHPLWTAAPGRVLGGLILGAWLGRSA